jgi:hypothetical protein
MAGSINVINQFAAQAGPIPLSQLDANFSQDAQALNSLGTFSNYYQDTGTTNAWAVTVTAPQVFSYSAGINLSIKVANLVTGSVTLNVNGLGAKNVTNPDGTALGSGQVSAGAIVDLFYDGTQFQLNGGAQSTFNAVPTSRTVSTTAPLTGGGALSSNLTLGVSSFGSGNSGVVAASGGGTNTVLRADGSWSTQFSGGNGWRLGAPVAGQVTLTLTAASGFGALAITGTAGATSALIQNPGGAGTLGLQIQSGTTSSDNCALLQSSVGSTFFQVRGDGATFFPAISTTASAANAFLDLGSNNNLLRSTSSVRYKHDIQEISYAETAALTELHPISYRSKAEADDPNLRWYGLTAEDVAEHYPRLVHYDEQGRPDGVMYDRIVVLLLKRVQELEKRLSKFDNNGAKNS